MVLMMVELVVEVNHSLTVQTVEIVDLVVTFQLVVSAAAYKVVVVAAAAAAVAGLVVKVDLSLVAVDHTILV